MSGFVRLNGTAEDQAIQSVGIYFTGRCKVKITQNNGQNEGIYRSRGYYFRLQHPPLFAGGKYTHKAGTYDWPFSFQIPTEVDKSRTTWCDGDVFEPGMGYRGSQDVEPHYLPDTTSKSNGSSSNGWEAHVEYTLHADLQRPAEKQGIFRTGNLQCEKAVRVESKRTSEIQQKYKRLDSVRLLGTLKLLPEYNRKLSMKEKMSGAFMSSRLPTLKLHFAMYMPQILGTESFPISFGVFRLPRDQHEKCIADEVPTPMLKIKSLELKVEGTTRCRDKREPGGFFSNSAGGTEKSTLFARECDLEVPVIEMDAKGIEAGACKPEIDLSELLGVKTLSNLAPGFRTFNIVYGHTLVWRVKAECCEEKINWQGSMSLDVVPQMDYASLPPPVDEIAEKTDIAVVKEELPAYEP